MGHCSECWRPPFNRECSPAGNRALNNPSKSAHSSSASSGQTDGRTERGRAAEAQGVTLLWLSCCHTAQEHRCQLRGSIVFSRQTGSPLSSCQVGPALEGRTVTADGILLLSSVQMLDKFHFNCLWTTQGPEQPPDPVLHFLSPSVLLIKNHNI